MSSINHLLKLKTAKHIAPDIFQNKTPKNHTRVLDFLNAPAKFKAITMFRGGGKTTVVNKTDMFSSIFFEHEPYTQIFSVNNDKAKKFLKDVKTMLTNAIIKGYDIVRGDVWTNTEIEVVVDGKHRCYIEVLGAGEDPRGGSFNFMRPTKQVFDDIESHKGQYAIKSRANREKLQDWFWGDCIPALDPIVGKAIIVGTILHDDSLLNNILKDDDWEKLVIPIIENGKSSWGDRFPLTAKDARAKEKEYFEKTGKEIEVHSIEEIKAKHEKRGQLKLFYQEYMCVAQSEESRLFKQSYFKYFSHIEYSGKIKYLRFKNSLENRKVAIREPKFIVKDDGSKIEVTNTTIYATNDLASSGGKANDKTAIIVCCYDSKNNMYVAEILAGTWTPFEKSLHVIKSYVEWRYRKIGVEKAGMQNDFFYTIDEAQKAMNIKVPVEPISHGGVNKQIRISNLEPLFLAGKIFFNRSDANTSELEAQLLAFDIDVESGKNDLIDTLAYQHYFIKGRSFDYEEYWEDDEEGALWS